jgi:hypothetical protein
VNPVSPSRLSRLFLHSGSGLLASAPAPPGEGTEIGLDERILTTLSLPLGRGEVGEYDDVEGAEDAEESWRV